jgi:hypothetical protein
MKKGQNKILVKPQEPQLLLYDFTPCVVCGETMTWNKESGKPPTCSERHYYQ